MKPSRRILLVTAGLALAGAVAWLILEYDPRAREIRHIQQRLGALATAVSFRENDPPFVRLGYGGRLTDYFAESVEIDIALGSRGMHETINREQLKEGATGLRAANRGLSVEFIDIAVTPGPTSTNASAHLTSKIYFIGDPDYFVQEFRIDLRKGSGDWQVRRIATVRTME